MQAKTLRRIMLTAVAAPALAFGAPAVAMADVYYESGSSGAGPHGAYQYEVGSHAGDDGTWYYKSFSKAGPHGAYSSNTVSGTD